MGDTSEASSIAAQSAPTEDERSGGFFSRLFAGNKSDEDFQSLAEQDQRHLPSGNVHNLYRLRVEDVAVPRADITAVPIDINLPDLIEVFRNSSYSRLPVYQGVLDNPVGFLHLKDVVMKYGFNAEDQEFNASEIMRKLLFAPPSMTIGVLLQSMQADRIHMALVIDEYGGVDGLLTIEDLVETVLGEIIDEHDTEEDDLWTEEGDGVYVIQARAPLEDIEHLLGVTLVEDNNDEEIDTAGGLVFMLTGRIPAKGEIIQHPSGYEFLVLDADPRKIKKLRVARNLAAE